MGSNFHTPGETRDVLGSLPSRWITGSVDFLRGLILVTPATYLPSHLTRNFMFLYGSKRVGFTVNCVIGVTSRADLPVDRSLPRHSTLHRHTARSSVSSAADNTKSLRYGCDGSRKSAPG